MITFALFLASMSDPFFPGMQPMPNPKPEDCIIIVIPAQPKVEFNTLVTT